MNSAAVAGYGEEAILVASGIEKTFDRTRALAGADLELRAGEVHGLLGANGAGKSTLSKVISGHVQRDAGRLVYKGRPLALRSTREALEAGIAIVMQETSLAPDLSVLENIFLPELGRPGLLSYGSMRRRAVGLLANLGHEHVLPLDREVARLSAAQRQLVEIAKALALDADLIIFDEPTASLSPSEVERLFDIMAKLRDDGRALIFVSHRLEEVFAITDRVTIMREGATVAASQPTASLTQAEVIRHMVGRDIGALYATPGLQEEDERAPAVFSVENLAAPPAVRNVSFFVRRGEILGLGGLVGAGRSETAEAIFGLRPRSAGTIRLEGREIAPRKPADAVRAGIGFVAEDRRVQNIVPDLSVKENLLLAHLGAHRGFGLGYRRRRQKVEELMAALGLPAERLLDANMLNFSGGMQQKIIIARWLLLEPKVLILDEPTKGVDIGTRQAIYGILRRIADEGVAVVVISSDFEELLGVCERVVVMSDGNAIADLPSALLDEEKLTLLAAPRTSMTRNTEVLTALSGECGGVGFWALLDEDRLLCLNSVVADPAAAPGFAAGEAKRLADTRIPAALARRGGDFVTEPDGSRATLLVPVTSRRGHDLGWIGLTLPGEAARPAAERVRERIEALNAEAG
ncbi:monosaccharide ABC transporter ATP-binding protein, CUT2 family [Tistlia consotensis]|uniref:Monosaccharide ABC transporter ATP-binding protein, CUT2 family n=1 Tax=Tistlia consotensis USBA 355 TaxID=560819 RepID=A0A1Y6B8P9_9PROT|nr:sugar ABC transporter ATP-binding protein [Tistlia consotensis]SME90299.1 monosaccharide ABC transporter ATP-binding protein, CUT2 family [Tistlia consotensis USBA 355]SNR26607.1 monosaccharide ABC transporter ATP-binding protein, CUT2 family [Tistlia consotensis]